MAENKVNWKTHSKDNAKKLLEALKDRHICVYLKERKNLKSKEIKGYVDGIMYGDEEALKEQKRFVTNLPELNMYNYIEIKK